MDVTMMVHVGMVAAVGGFIWAAWFGIRRPVRVLNRRPRVAPEVSAQSMAQLPSRDPRRSPTV